MASGRTKSDKDIKSVYRAAISAQGGKSGRSVSDQALYYLYKLSSGQGMLGGAKPKKKSSLPAGHPKGGKFKKGGTVKKKYARGGKVRRKAKY